MHNSSINKSLLENRPAKQTSTAYRYLTLAYVLYFKAFSAKKH